MASRPAGPLARRTAERLRAERLTIREQAISDAAVEVFAGVLGGRSALAELLAFSDDPRVEDALSYLAEDPGKRPESMSLREICHRADLTVADLFRAFLDATMLRAKIRAAPIIADRLAATTTELMDGSVTRTNTCRRCHGTTTITIRPRPTKATPVPQPELIPCDRCDGVGTISIEPDLERQKVALMLGGLLKQPGGAQQNVQVNLPPPPAPLRSYEQEQAEVDDWLRHPQAGEAAASGEAAAPIVEGEVVAAEPG